MLSDTEVLARSRCQTPFMVVSTGRKKTTRRKPEAEKREKKKASTFAVKVKVCHQRSEKRQVFRNLLGNLDDAIPAKYRSARKSRGAGTRSLGSAGRSIHDILTDAMRAVADRRSEQSDKVKPCSGSVTIEVEMPGWIISAMSPGARLFFKNAPWGCVEGHSLEDFVLWEDLNDFNALCPCRATSQVKSAKTQESRIRLLHWQGFSEEDLAVDNEQCLAPQLDKSDHEDVLAIESTFRCSAFEDDPLLCDQPKSSCEASVWRCKYVEAQVQVLRIHDVSSSESIGSASTRALVAISML